MNAAEFQALLATATVDEVTETVLLGADSVHVAAEDQAYVRQSLADTFGVALEQVATWIVGSAKLGFSITEKRVDATTTLPRYRPFRVDSDIDIAVVAPPIFDSIWADLSRNASKVARWPANSGQLGHYLVHGWMRPDHFPRDVRLRHCDAWWDLIRALSSDPRFDRHAVRGALFYSYADLALYQRRAAAECRLALEGQP